MNPGPTILTECGERLDKVRQEAKEMVELQGAFERAKMLAGGEARAQGLRTFALDRHYFVSSSAFSALTKCGLDALPALREMLSDQSASAKYAEIVRSFAEAGGPAVDGEIVALVRRETSFWKSVAPGLKAGWRDDVVDPRMRELHARSSISYAALNALIKTHPAECRAAVTEARDFWQSLSRLDDKSSLDSKIEFCDRILTALPPVKE
jgi:hypothetical protein